MTLDEAIKHCMDIAETLCSNGKKCAEEHRQLAEWLKELKALREVCVSEAFDMAIEALGQKSCEDAIDRAEAMTEIMMFAGNVKPDEEDIHIKVSDAVQLLRELPPVTPQPKTGRWIDDKCSVCGKGIEDLIESSEWYRNESPKYCPFCGIKIQPYKAESEYEDEDSN